MKVLFDFLRLLSIDIVAGVVAGTLFAVTLLEIKLPMDYFLLITLTTWLIYLGDHILDGFRTGKTSHNPVRSYFYRHRYTLILLAGAIFLIDFYILIRMDDPSIFILGLILSLGVVLYFLQVLFISRSAFFLKELWISVIYTAAVWGGPLIYAGNPAEDIPLPVISSYFFLVFANVLSFSFFEVEQDRMEGPGSFAVFFGKTTCRIMIYGLLTAAALFSLADLLTEGSFPFHYLVLLLMTLGLWFLVSFPSWFEKNRNYGWYADSLFLLPFLSLLQYLLNG